jgi:2-dehydropantoate 2-reductase
MSSNSYTYAILGTGALGGFYGARLQQAGLEVHFLVHSDYEQVHQHGLVIESPDGDFTLPQVNAYQNVKEMPPCDVAIVALKTTQNSLLPQLLPPVLKQNSIVLVLQNGMGIEATVAEIVGSDRNPSVHVLGGLCFLCSNKIAPGHIRHLDYKLITLGEYCSGYKAAGISDRMRQIASDFGQAEIPIELTEDLLTARWKKLLWNIPFNGLSVVLNATTDEIMAHQAVRSLVQQLTQEVLTGAAACGCMIPNSFVDQMLDRTAKMQPYRTSMKLDYDERRPLELEAIFKNPLQMAQQADVDLPKTQMLYQQLQFLDQKNRSI